jgi:hypothetical protein
MGMMCLPYNIFPTIHFTKCLLFVVLIYNDLKYKPKLDEYFTIDNLIVCEKVLSIKINST